jgi:hypothetical protein
VRRISCLGSLARTHPTILLPPLQLPTADYGCTVERRTPRAYRRGDLHPSIDLEGKIDISVRVDKHILSALNSDGAFSGKLIRGENVGKTSDELVALWNEEHPTDLIPVEA